jgi:cysteine desulfurase/selenocysteine lyase
MTPLDPSRIKRDFPILERTVRDGKPLVYLDSAATSQKPRSVLDAERGYYELCNAAVHRGAHQLAEEATEAYEGARVAIASFIGAEPSDIVYTKNATESLNLVAYAFSNATALHRAGGNPPQDPRFIINTGDNVVVTEMEHHANLVPWQELCAKTGAELRWLPLTDEGRLDLGSVDSIIDERTKLVSIVHQSNILGTINPVASVMSRTHEVGAVGMVDACQSIPHMPIKIRELGADLVAWSGHKMLGPTGIGFLWGTSEILDAMPPFITGGSMIEIVKMEGSSYAKAPQKFEAGTQMVAQTIGMRAAVEYLTALGMDAVESHEHALTGYALDQLALVPGVTVIGPTENVNRGSAISFTVEGLHPHDVGQVLDNRGIAVRVGHHCAWPTCRRFRVPATTRLSTYIYNDRSDIDAAVSGIVAAQEFFGVK